MNSNLNSHKFLYDQTFLSGCAEREGSKCKDLFAQHQQFYRRTRATQDNYDRFVQMVDFIHRHNLLLGKQSTYSVSLNQFSDQLESDLPLYELDSSSWQKHSQTSNLYNHAITILSNEEIINGFLRDYSQQKTHATKSQTPTQDVPGCLANFTDLYHVDFRTDDDDFQSHLDWSTQANPDGIPLVHPPIDQGHCGSCWAFAAIGSLEAIASRRAGYAVYNSIMTYSMSDSTPASFQRLAVTSAQQTALDVHQKTHLSTQELISCDHLNQGCTGGNPLMAFPFIKKFGLLTNSQYPYTGKDQKCQKRTLKEPPVVTADEWAVLRSNDEETIKEIIRYIGPVAVGINGSSSGFLHYSGGIFDGECKTTLNHALLIVGYGEEMTEKGLVKYWIARNSWGSNWGENGFIRIKRSGKFGDEGVCGIARFPSVAIGGNLIEKPNLWGSNHGGLGERKKTTHNFLIPFTDKFLSGATDNEDVWIYSSTLCSVVIVMACILVFIRRFSGRRREHELQKHMRYSHQDYGSIIQTNI